MFLREFLNLEEKPGCNMTNEGRACAVHGLAECPGYKMVETSAQKKLHQRHQELRKKSGLPNPDYYKELKSTFDLPDEERWAAVAAIKKKYNVNEAGPFSYGAKKPRKGSVADLAAKKRKEQEKDKQPAEPKDHMVGVARVVKDVAEGKESDLRKLQVAWYHAMPEIMKSAGLEYKQVQKLSSDLYPTLGKIRIPGNNINFFNVSVIPQGDKAKVQINLDVESNNSLYRHAQPETAQELNDFAASIAQALGGEQKAKMTGERGNHPGVGSVSAVIELPKDKSWRNPSAGYDPVRRFLDQPGERARQSRVARSAYSDTFGGDASNYRKFNEQDVAEDAIDDRLTAQYNTPQMQAKSQSIDQAFASGNQQDFDRLGIISPQQIERDYQAMRAKEPAQDAALYANPKLTPGARAGSTFKTNPRGVPMKEKYDVEEDSSYMDTKPGSVTAQQAQDFDDAAKRAFKPKYYNNDNEPAPKKRDWDYSDPEIAPLVKDWMNKNLIDRKPLTAPARNKDSIDESIEQYLEELDRAGYEVITETAHTCPECGGPAFANRMLAEKKDACYSKVKSRYKVWPSAYASGALVRCRKVGAKNWGNKSKK